MENTLESFINFCDDMIIAEEATESYNDMVNEFVIANEGKIINGIKRLINNTINKKLTNNKKTSTPKEKVDTQFTFSLSKASGSDFEKLYHKEAYCAEGMANASSDDTAKVFLDHFSKFEGCAQHINFYYCSGKDLNDYYHLTDNNAYPNDLGIFFIAWDNFDTNKFDVALHKGKFRYFSDVVDNNARREIRKNNPHYKNYHSLYGDSWFYSTI